jgi:DNA-binding NarL/FixJ family response regulator
MKARRPISAFSRDLAAREWEVLALLAQGRTSKEIASALNITASTVSSHRKSLCRKLNVHSAAELVHAAMIITARTAAFSS